MLLVAAVLVDLMINGGVGGGGGGGGNCGDDCGGSGGDRGCLNIYICVGWLWLLVEMAR